LTLWGSSDILTCDVSRAAGMETRRLLPKLRLLRAMVVATTGRDLVALGCEFRPEVLVHEVSNLNRILIFVCYSYC
jgi:hypothetical protein